MPYDNVPRHLWGKMDSCVKQVMAREGVSKQRAIAICHTSVVKEEGQVNARQRRKARRVADRQADDAKGTNSDPEVLAALALADEPESLAAFIAGKDAADDEQPPEPTDTELAEEETTPPTEEETAEEPALTEGKEKDYVLEVYRCFDGATSWSDYDAYLKARDQMRAVNDLTYVFEELVRNVMHDPDIALQDKAEAIAALATGYKSRLSSSTKGIGGMVEAFKRALSGGSRNDLPDSSFAYIEPGGKKDEDGRTIPRSLRHYPIHDKAHVRNALSRAAAAVKSGGKTGEIARRALPKIRAAAKRLGVGESAKKPGAKSGFQVVKGTDGGFRWVGWVSNKWRDRDTQAAPKHGGEIITSDAHKEFVGWVYQEPASRMPELWLWHTPGTARKARADWIDFADGFLVASGPLTDDEAGELMALELQYDLGMSHGLFAQADKEKGYITQYRSFEQTVLPQDFAANPWTAFSTILKEVSEMGFSEDKRGFLVSALGEARVAELEGTTEGMAKTLLDLGIEHKAIEPAPALVRKEVPPIDPQPEGEPPEGMKALEPLVTALTATVAEQVIKAINPQGLSKTLETIDGRLKAVEAGTAKQLAEQIRPKAGPLFWDRPSASKENVVSPGEELPQPEAKSPDGDDWMSDVFGQLAATAAGAGAPPA